MSEKVNGNSTRHLGLFCSEAIRESMAGIGIRYFEMARHLSHLGFKVSLIHPGESTPWHRQTLARIEWVTFDGLATLRSLEAFDVLIGQGYLANSFASLFPKIPKVFDFYDPWLVENLSYASSLGQAPFLNDLASWKLQFLEGDFFLCSSQVQKSFYLGFLTALGRINPDRVQRDPTMESLISPVPFGIPRFIPEYQPLMGRSEGSHRHILFGGLYDWYDPWTLLQALERIKHHSWEVWFVKNPNPETTPQELLSQLEEWLDQNSWLKERVKFLDWVPFERRFDLLREADVLVAPHRVSLETRLCMRTRYLDAIAVGCPCITSEGGGIADLFSEFKAGVIVKEGDECQLAENLEALLWGESLDLSDGMGALTKSLSWERALKPLVEFCKDPKIDPGKKFAKRTCSEPRSWWSRLLSRFH